MDLAPSMPPAALPATPALDEAFEQLALSSTERRAYAFLLEKGTATPTQIADATGQSRGRIYETLRLLVEHGLAREEPRRPVRYAPVPPSEVVAGALESAQRRGMALRQAYGSLARLAPAPVAAVAPTRASDVAVLAGRKAIAAEMRRLVGRAREVVHLEGRANLARRLAADEPLVDALREARRRGADVHLHLGPGVDAALRKSLESKVGPSTFDVPATPPHVTTLLTEAAVLLALAQPDDDGPEGDDVAHRAESPALVRALRTRFAPDDGTAHEATAPRSAVDAVDAAQRSIDVLGNTAWGADVAAPSQEFLQAVRRARGRGVAVRILLTVADRPTAVPSDVLTVADVRMTDWVPARFAIVDGQVHHFETTGVRASADPPEVRFLRELFDRLWADATEPHP